jgi:predicted nucleotidyltransferase
MSVIGIVCEYNPFHNGHAWHIRKSRKAVPDSPVICVMSGDFVQRGEGAMYSKYARAKAACACGARHS